MEIVNFDRGFVIRNMENLLEMEEHYSSYEQERWSAENFLIDVPKKWQYSCAAIDTKQGILGYNITSLKEIEDGTPCAYIHRNLVLPNLRGGKILLYLIKKAFCTVKEDEVDLVRWMCSKKNTRVYEFHLGFADKIVLNKTIGEIEYSLFERRI